MEIFKIIVFNIVTYIIVPLVVGSVASVIATIITNEKVSVEKIIKRKVLEAIRKSLNACGESRSLIGFNEKTFVKDIVVWQEYKNEILSLIKQTEDFDLKIRIKPEKFSINKTVSELNWEEIEAYTTFCGAFISEFDIAFSMDRGYGENMDRKAEIDIESSVLRAYEERTKEMLGNVFGRNAKRNPEARIPKEDEGEFFVVDMGDDNNIKLEADKVANLSLKEGEDHNDG